MVEKTSNIAANASSIVSKDFATMFEANYRSQQLATKNIAKTSNMVENSTNMTLVVFATIFEANYSRH